MELHAGATAELKHVMEAARLCAIKRGSHEIQPADMLLGMLEVPQARARSALTAMRADLTGLKRALEALLSTGEPAVRDAVVGPELRVIMSAAIRRAAEANEDLASDHVLLALCSSPASLPFGVLTAAGIDCAEMVRRPEDDALGSIDIAMPDADFEVAPSRHWGELQAVVPIGRSAKSEVVTFELLLLEVRATLAVLHVRAFSPSPQFLGSPRLQVSDDIGTPYAAEVDQWSGGGGAYVGEVVLRPSPPRTAISMTARLVGFESGLWPRGAAAVRLAAPLSWDFLIWPEGTG